MNDGDGDATREIQSGSPANDNIARMMDWVGLSAAIGMIVVAAFLSA
jgi:hypothetical protein